MDYIIRGTAADHQIRFFAANTHDLVETARSIHQTSPVATAAMGRLMTAAAMMGAMLKGEKDLLTLQIKGDGPLGGIVITTDSKANVKGYVYNPEVELPLNEKGKLDVAGALGQGMLTIIRDVGLKDPYVGQTALVVGEIAEDLTYYFYNSEQIPSAVALGVLVDRDYTVKQSGGFIIQLLPNADEELITKLENNLSGVRSITAMLDDGKSPEDIMYEVFKDMDFEILERIDTQFSCNCSKERVEKALISIGRKDIQEMIDDGEPIEMHCHFCNEKYTFTVPEMQELIERI